MKGIDLTASPFGAAASRSGAALVVALALAGCFSPHAAPGAPCSEDGACPSGLACIGAVCVDPSTPPPDGPVDAAVDAQLIDGCVPVPEICGNGIDEDCDGNDPPCPANDLPAGAIDITNGGMLTLGIAAAHSDDTGHGCSPSGGRDVFYKVNLAAPTVFYVDTFNSNFDTVIRMYPGKSCTQIGSSSATCSNDACGGSHSQVAAQLPAGTSCIVIAQHDSDETMGGITMRAINTGHTGTALNFNGGTTAMSATSTTCGLTNTIDTMCTADAGSPGIEYYFMTCPGSHKVDLSDCDATWDSVIYLADSMDKQLTCNDDSDMTVACAASSANNSYISAASANGPGIYWAGIAGYTSNDCGSFTLTVAIH